VLIVFSRVHIPAAFAIVQIWRATQPEASTCR
jgi:hypothetical protein